MDLLGGSSDSDTDDKDILNTNNDYAAKYDNWRGKEHLQKLKDKYGDRDLEEEEDDSSSEESEDEEAEELTPEVEKDFFVTLASLKTKDPSIYDGKTSFFKEKSESSKEKQVKEKSKKVTLADMERKVILENEGKYEEIEEGGEGITTYNDEMKNIKDSFKTALVDDDTEDDEEGLLTKRKKTKEESKREEEDYKQWLAGQKDSVDDDSVKEKMSGLREYWNKSKLDDDEKFLRDYILNKRYLENENDDYVPSYDEVVHDSDEDLSEDERNVEKQEEFEHKYNFRFEEPDEEFIKRYPRTIKDSLRRDDDKRKSKRKEVEERKKQEKDRKKEEIKMLKNMKKKEIMDKLEKLKQITGNQDMEMDEDDIEGDFDPEKYDKKMAEIFSNYDDDVAVDEEKPTFSDFEDDFDDNYGEEFEDWDNWTGTDQKPSDEGGDGNEAEPHCEDEDFIMDCDYQQEIVESTKRKKGRRKSKFTKALESNSTKPAFDPEDKTFTEYVEEYYKLDCEDLIGDLPCRFKYRSVQPNDFGLSVEEVLSAEDKELNAWVSLRKTCQYRNEEDERKDFHVFRNKAKDGKLKKKLLPSLFDSEANAGEAEDSKPSSNVEDKPQSKLETEAVVVGKKRKRRNKKKKSTPTSNPHVQAPPSKKPKTDASDQSSKKQSEGTPTTKSSNSTKKKKKKGGNQSNAAVIQVQKIVAAYKGNPKSRKPQVNGDKKSELGNFSEDRLKAYGINPNQVKRKLKGERFKSMGK